MRVSTVIGSAPRQIKAKVLGDGKDVFVTAATHVHDDQMIGRQVRRNPQNMGERVGADMYMGAE